MCLLIIPPTLEGLDTLAHQSERIKGVYSIKGHGLNSREICTEEKLILFLTMSSKLNAFVFSEVSP